MYLPSLKPPHSRNEKPNVPFTSPTRLKGCSLSLSSPLWVAQPIRKLARILVWEVRSLPICSEKIALSVSLTLPISVVEHQTFTILFIGRTKCSVMSNCEQVSYFYNQAIWFEIFPWMCHDKQLKRDAQETEGFWHVELQLLCRLLVGFDVWEASLSDS